MSTVTPIATSCTRHTGAGAVTIGSNASTGSGRASAPTCPTGFPPTTISSLPAAQSGCGTFARPGGRNNSGWASTMAGRMSPQCPFRAACRSRTSDPIGFWPS